jgi:hypothetical protein
LVGHAGFVVAAHPSPGREILSQETVTCFLKAERIRKCLLFREHTNIMKSIIGFLSTALFLASAGVAQVSPTNIVDPTHAIKAASQLSIGMREEVAESILATNGLRNPAKMGVNFSWISSYPLADQSSLTLQIRASRADPKGAWTNGLVRAASIQDRQGVDIISIVLTNRP